MSHRGRFFRFVVAEALVAFIRVDCLPTAISSIKFTDKIVSFVLAKAVVELVPLQANLLRSIYANYVMSLNLVYGFCYLPEVKAALKRPASVAKTMMIPIRVQNMIRPEMQPSFSKECNFLGAWTLSTMMTEGALIIYFSHSHI